MSGLCKGKVRGKGLFGRIRQLFTDRPDPFPMPDQMEEQGNTHGIAGINMDIGQEYLDRFTAGEQMKINDDTGNDADQPADEQQ